MSKVTSDTGFRTRRGVHDTQKWSYLFNMTSGSHFFQKLMHTGFGKILTIAFQNFAKPKTRFAARCKILNENLPDVLPMSNFLTNETGFRTRRGQGLPTQKWSYFFY